MKFFLQKKVLLTISIENIPPKHECNLYLSQGRILSLRSAKKTSSSGSRRFKRKTRLITSFFFLEREASLWWGRVEKICWQKK
jgi:hypothetical protein